MELQRAIEIRTRIIKFLLIPIFNPDNGKIVNCASKFYTGKHCHFLEKLFKSSFVWKHLCHPNYKQLSFSNDITAAGNIWVLVLSVSSINWCAVPLSWSEFSWLKCECVCMCVCTPAWRWMLKSLCYKSVKNSEKAVSSLAQDWTACQLHYIIGFCRHRSSYTLKGHLSSSLPLLVSFSVP